MKRYLIITTSGHEYIIQAPNLSEAQKIGRTICRRTGETFERCRQIRK